VRVGTECVTTREVGNPGKAKQCHYANKSRDDIRVSCQRAQKTTSILEASPSVMLPSEPEKSDVGARSM